MILRQKATALAFSCGILQGFSLADEVSNPILHLDIKRQPLALSLSTLFQQADVDYVVASRLTDNRIASELSGHLSLKSALQQLLYGSGLFYSIEKGAYLIKARQSSTRQASAHLDETLVTAQKRYLSLHETPLPMQVVDPEDLLNQGKISTRNISRNSPSMTYHGAISAAGQGLRLRGIGSSLIATGIEQSVGSTLDEVVTGPSGSSLQNLWDMERIEVLRGPQGILFGKNATAGLIRLVSKPPA